MTNIILCAQPVKKSKMLSSKRQMHNLDKSTRVMFTLCNRPSGTEDTVPINIDGMTVSTTDSKYFRLIFFVIYQLHSSFKICGQSLQHVATDWSHSDFCYPAKPLPSFKFFYSAAFHYLYKEWKIILKQQHSWQHCLSCLPFSLMCMYCLTNVMLNPKIVVHLFFSKEKVNTVLVIQP